MRKTHQTLKCLQSSRPEMWNNILEEIFGKYTYIGTYWGSQKKKKKSWKHTHNTS